MKWLEKIKIKKKYYNNNSKTIIMGDKYCFDGINMRHGTQCILHECYSLEKRHTQMELKKNK